MNKDQAKGYIAEASGTVKEIAGKLVGNEKLALKGRLQHSAGKIRVAMGEAKESREESTKAK